MPRDFAGLFAIAGIKGRLPAARLGLGKIDLVSDPFQHVGHGEPDLRENLVNDTSDKQRDAADGMNFDYMLVALYRKMTAACSVNGLTGSAVPGSILNRLEAALVI